MNNENSDNTKDKFHYIVVSDKNGNTSEYNRTSSSQKPSTSHVNWNSANLEAMVVDYEMDPAVDSDESISSNHQYADVLDHQKSSSDFTSKPVLARSHDPTSQCSALDSTEKPDHLHSNFHSLEVVQDQKVEPSLPQGQKPDGDLHCTDYPAALELSQAFDMKVDKINSTFIVHHTIEHALGSPQPTSVRTGNTSLSSSTWTSPHSSSMYVKEINYNRESFDSLQATPSQALNRTYTAFSDVPMQTDFPGNGDQCQYSLGELTKDYTDGTQQRLVEQNERKAVSDGMEVPNGSILQESYCVSRDELNSEIHSQSSYGQKEMSTNLRETVPSCHVDDECPLLVPAFDKNKTKALDPEHEVTSTENPHVPSHDKGSEIQSSTVEQILSCSPVQMVSSFEMAWCANGRVISTNSTVCMSTPVLKTPNLGFTLSPIEATEKSNQVDKGSREAKHVPSSNRAPANTAKPSLGKSDTKMNIPTGSKVRKTEIISYPRPNFKNIKAKVISRPVSQAKDEALMKVTPKPHMTSSLSPVPSSRPLSVLSKTPRSDFNAEKKAEVLINKTHKQRFNKLITSQAVHVTTHSKNAPHRLPRTTSATKSNQEDVDKTGPSHPTGEPGSVAAFIQKIKGILPVKMKSSECLETTYISNISGISPEKGEEDRGAPMGKQELKKEGMHETFEYESLFVGSTPKTATAPGKNITKADSCSLRKTSGLKAKVGPAVSCLRRKNDNRSLASDRALSPQRIRRVSSSGKPTSLKTAQPSWVSSPRPLPKSKACLKSSVLRRTGSAQSVASSHSDLSTCSNTSGNATVIKYEEKPPKQAFQNGSGSLYLKPLVPIAHAHLLKTSSKGPSRKSIFTAFNSVEKGRQKNPRSLCIQTQTSPDVLSSEKTLELAQYKTKCENQSGFILQLKQLLSCGNTKFEALTIVIQHLLSEREEALRQHKTLSEELVNLRGELVAASTTCEKLEKARNELQTAYEGFVQKLNQQHQTDRTELENQLKEFYTGECEKLQNIYIEEAEKYKTQLQEQFDNLNAAHETSKLEIEASHSEKVELLKNAYETTLSEIKKSHEMEKKSLENILNEKQELLEKQINDLKSENDALNEKLKSEEQKRISREKANSKNPQVMYLEQELESLKAVLEIKNEKLHQQDIKLMKMEKLVDNNTALVDKLKRFQQENEELKARMDKHMAISRQLSSEQAALQESLEKESKVNKRLSMENEELLWKLHNGDLCSPKRSPTSSAIPFPSPRNSGSFPSPSSSPR